MGLFRQSPRKAVAEHLLGVPSTTLLDRAHITNWGLLLVTKAAMTDYPALEIQDFSKYNGNVGDLLQQKQLAKRHGKVTLLLAGVEEFKDMSLRDYNDILPSRLHVRGDTTYITLADTKPAQTTADHRLMASRVMMQTYREAHNVRRRIFHDDSVFSQYYGQALAGDVLNILSPDALNPQQVHSAVNNYIHGSVQRTG